MERPWPPASLKRGYLMKPDNSFNKKSNTFKSTVRSFHYRNYRLYFSGQGISLIGTWAQITAMSWLVYSMTNSAFFLGVVGFVSQIPAFLFAPFAGVLIDRWNRRRTFIVTSTLAMLQALVLSVLVLTGKVSIWHIIPLSLFLGFVNSFDLPVRQSFVFDIVEKREDLGNAIALNTLLFNLGRLLGPTIAGILISAVGEGLCFFLNSISYLAIIAALLAMKVEPQQIVSKHAHFLKGLKEGFVYVMNSTPLRSIILLQGLVSLMGWSAMVLMPVFAKEILQGGPHTLGLLMGFSGTGALIGTLYLATRKSAPGLVRFIPLAAGMLGIGLIVFAQSRIPWLSMFLLLFTGFGVYVQIASSGTVLQTIVDDDKRGRVMSFYTMAFTSTTFGSLLAGGLASKIGAPNTLMISGIFCIAGALFFVSKYQIISEAVNQHLHIGTPGKTTAV